MTTRHKLTVLAAALLMASCAQPQTKQSALEIQPFEKVQHSYDQAKAQYQLGRYYHGQLRYAQAIQAYRAALTLNPNMVDARNALGAAYAESGQLDLARQQFEAALKHQPDSAYTYNNLGYVNYLAGRYAAAVAAYKDSLRLDPTQQKARQNLVLAYARMGEGEQIARTEVPAPPVPQPAAAQTAPTVAANETQGAWVKIAPQVYELHSEVAQVQSQAAEPAAALPSAPVAQTAMQETALPSRAAESEQAAPAAAVAPAAYTTPTLRRAAFEPAASGGSAHGPMARVAALLRGVEVSNGNGIRGFAARVAHYFSGRGLVQPARLTNQRPFVERHTRIEYRPGSAVEANRINELLPKSVPMVASRSLRPDIRVRLVLGHDLPRNVVAWDQPARNERVTAELTGMTLPAL